MIGKQLKELFKEIVSLNKEFYFGEENLPKTENFDKIKVTTMVTIGKYYPNYDFPYERDMNFVYNQGLLIDDDIIDFQLDNDWKEKIDKMYDKMHSMYLKRKFRQGERLFEIEEYIKELKDEL